MSSTSPSQYTRHEFFNRIWVTNFSLSASNEGLRCLEAAFFCAEDALIYLDRHLNTTPETLKVVVETYFKLKSDKAMAIFTDDNKVIVLESLG